MRHNSYKKTNLYDFDTNGKYLINRIRLENIAHNAISKIVYDRTINYITVLFKDGGNDFDLYHISLLSQTIC